MDGTDGTGRARLGRAPGWGQASRGLGHELALVLALWSGLGSVWAGLGRRGLGRACAWAWAPGLSQGQSPGWKCA